MKMKNTVLYTIICSFGFFALLGCNNALLSPPTFQTGSSTGDSDANVSVWGAPQKVTVSHGQKKQVTLAWEAVRGAVRYTVYSSDSPFSDFKSAKESALPEAVISEKSGVIKYYKVYAVDKYGKQSDASIVVTGSSLGVPQITNISRTPDMESSSLVIEWLVPNIGSGISTYEDVVTYTVFYADASGTKKEAGKIDAKVGGAAQQFTVTGLEPLANYYFAVQSALASTPDVIEESLAVDMATAQKMKPDKPANLKAEQGMNKDKIILTWTCPGNVELPKKDALGEYETTPLFFKIYRKKTGAVEFALLAEHKASPGTPFLEGDVITFEDSNVPEDAVYEYRVQSFADSPTNPSTSNLAIAETTGWKLRPILKFNRTITNDREQNESSTGTVTSLTITFKADWSNYGNEAPYTVSLLEEKSIGNIDFSSDSQTAVTENLGFANGVLVNTTGEAVSFKKTVVPGTPEYYRYTLKISRDGATVLETIGASVVVAEVAAPIAEFTSVTDGYVDKAVFEWKFEQGTEYRLQVRPVGSTEKTDYPIKFESDPNNDEKVSYELKGLNDNTDYEIAIEANNGVISQSDYSVVTTLGIPQVIINSYDSKKVTLSWATVKGGHEGVDPSTRPEKTATYKLTYQKLTTDAGNQLVSSEEVVDISGLVPSDGKLEYVLPLPEEHSKNGFVSGNPFNITVTAISAAVGGVVSKTVSAQLVGPAQAKLAATQAESTDTIDVSWNEIPGAQAYYIDRKSVTDNETDRYYVSGASETWNVVVYNPMGNEAAPHLAVVKNGTKLTLKDKVVPKETVEITADGKPKNYSDRQAAMRWGKQFEYSVVPLCGDDIEYTTIDKKTGYVFGYPKNIKATKAKHNNKVVISWDHADVPAGATKPQYKVFRKTETGTDSWAELQSSFMSGSNYTDSTIANKVGYRYLVAASYNNKVSDPRYDKAFETNFKKESFTAFNIIDEPLNVGYQLAKPEFAPTREEIKNADGAYGIKLNWDVNISGKYNRGIRAYKISIQNNNIDAQWHDVTEEIVANKPIYNEAFYTNSDSIKGKNLMKVLRDYKINFRITAIGDGEEIVAHGENWGARQITHLEFTKAAVIGMSTAMEKARSNLASSEGGTSYSGLSSSSSFNWGPSDFTITLGFTDYSAEHDSRAGKTVSAVRITGNLKGRGSTASAIQDKYFSDTIKVVYEGLNSEGTLFFDGVDDKGTKRVSRSGGVIKATWLGQNVDYNMGASPKPFTLPFIQYQTSYLNATDEWR